MTVTKRPTIRDVAQEAGVSKSLVSLVYSGDDKVSPERRAAVLAAAEKLGFTPNFWARSLATGASNFIGILVVDLHNPVFTELADLIRNELLKRGHESFMTAAIINDDQGVKSVEPSTVQALLDLRPRGIVVIGDLPDESSLDSVPESIPMIKVFTIPPKKLGRVTNIRSNDDEGMLKIVQHLTELKHKRIAYVGPVDSLVDRSRYEGYLHAMNTTGLKPITYICDRSESGGFQQTYYALKDQPGITAIVCFNDLVAIGAQDAINNYRNNGGHFVALTGYDNTHMASLNQISLTSIDQDKDAMAKKAAELLSSELPWSKLSGKDILFTPHLKIRTSSAPVK